ncbi:YfhO family protein [Candidatus Woesearchaeota archaeon]|nr:YfhO family protein [Candidatus Woesearchaeota archaeon]
MNIIYSPFSDLVAADLLWKELIHDSFQNFSQIPLWNPYTFGGMPFLAHHFSKIFYPPNSVFMFFSDMALLFNILYISHFFLAGAFFYLYAAKIGLSRFSSFIASVIYIFNGGFVMFIFAGLTNELPMMVFFPLTLYFFECGIKSRKDVYGILTGISLSLIILGAHTQKLIYTYLFLFVYFIFRILVVIKHEKNFKSVKDISLIYFLALLISVFLSAVQLLPSIEILKYDTRSRGLSYDFSTLGSFPPYHLITSVSPNFFGTLLHSNYWSLFPYWQLIIYLGIFPLILSLLAFKRKNVFAFFFLAICLVAIFLSFGRFNPLYHYFYNYIPLFRYLRAPARMLFFYFFSMPLIAGFGADFLIYIKSKQDKLFLRRMIAILTASIIFSILIFSGIILFKNGIMAIGNSILESKYSKSQLELGLQPLQYYKEKVDSNLREIRHDLILFICISIIGTLLLFLWYKKQVKVDYFKLGICALVIADLWLFSMPFIDLKGSDYVYIQNEIPSFLSKDKGYFRFLDMAKSIPQEIAVRYDLESINGYDGMVLYYYREYASEMASLPFFPSPTIPFKEIRHKKMLDLLNVKYVITTQKLKDQNYILLYNSTSIVYDSNDKKTYSDKKLEHKMLELESFQTNYVYENLEFVPRAFIVGNYIVAERSKIIEILKSGDFDPRKNVILEESVKLKQTGNAFKEADVTFYSPNKIKVEVDTDKPGFLVMSEIWYPGWKAFDNGKEARIYRANYIFRSVYLNNGHHEIEFIFDPLSYRIGKLITILTLMAISFYFAKIFFLSRD